ncbi:septum formation family protein [Demequina sp. NBRC 110057]|uniref:septum formation family protein n=1 Tax=Demequina sp. NBRC 110057 TaxID=1570346 RepID=UPI00135656E9|nr:septum formation family protein [Demequina sp. NBRC 110057]
MSDGFAPPPLPDVPAPGSAAPVASGPAPVSPQPASTGPSSPGPVPPARGRRDRPGVSRGVRWTLLAGAVAIVVGLAWALVLIVADTQAAPADADATGTLHAVQVVEGMCLESLDGDGTVADATVVDCSEPHAGEVVATVELPLEVYPGEEAVTERALETCTDRVGAVARNAEWVAWIPSSDSWTRGDRTVTCIVTSTDEMRDASRPGEAVDGENA